MKAQSPSEMLASLQETVRRLEEEEARNGLKSHHAELKLLLQKRIADLEASKPPKSEPTALEGEVAPDLSSSAG